MLRSVLLCQKLFLPISQTMENKKLDRKWQCKKTFIVTREWGYDCITKQSLNQTKKVNYSCNAYDEKMLS